MISFAPPVLRFIAGAGLGAFVAMLLGGCQATNPRRPTLLLPPPMVYATAVVP